MSFGVAIKAGGYDEDRASTLGVSDFTAAMLRKGTDGRKEGARRRRHLARDRLRGRSLDAQAGLESSIGRLLGAREGRGPLPRAALRHPAAPLVPRGRDGRGARADARGASPRASTAPTSSPSAHFDNQLFGEKNPHGWVLEPEDVQTITRDKPS